MSLDAGLIGTPLVPAQVPIVLPAEAPTDASGKVWAELFRFTAQIAADCDICVTCFTAGLLNTDDSALAAVLKDSRLMKLIDTPIAVKADVAAAGLTTQEIQDAQRFNTGPPSDEERV